MSDRKGVQPQTGSYTNYFADSLIAEAELDNKIIGIHAAMGGGTGMNRFENRFPDRTFDVGIAEQVYFLTLLLGTTHTMSVNKQEESLSFLPCFGRWCHLWDSIAVLNLCGVQFFTSVLCLKSSANLACQLCAQWSCLI